MRKEKEEFIIPNEEKKGEKLDSPKKYDSIGKIISKIGETFGDTAQKHNDGTYGYGDGGVEPKFFEKQDNHSSETRLQR